jgi:hypothetical protein
MFAISGKPAVLPARAAAGDGCEPNRMRCTQLPVQRSKRWRAFAFSAAG